MSQQQPTNGELARQRLAESGTSSEQDLFPPQEHQTKQSAMLGRRGAAPAELLVRPDFLLDVANFHEKYQLEYNGKPRILPLDVAKFRLDFNQEELDEWKEFAGKGLMAVAQDSIDQADVTHCIEMQLDAAVDQMYVLLGTVYLQGLMPVFEEAWRRVHAANMAKVRALRDGSDSKRGSAYDVVKPEGWIAPDHSDLVEDHAHR
ncbi:hypothetical protein POLEWNIK_00780 [Brevundimonas phage vB_BpoS-Polewnik]|nr:hypothetical protein POLEWNIK_00780 [Brevundimonas phage vB_BpoS-Polewnik]